MRFSLCFAILLLFFLTQVSGAAVTHQTLENFSKSMDAAFPKYWKARDSRGIPYHQIIEVDGNKFLRADVPADSVTIYRRVKWPIKDYPFFSWRWRVTRLPPGGNESIPESNDTAAAVYASWVHVFKMKTVSIKYIWSATLPVGTEWRQKDTWVIVIATGEKDLNKWQDNKVNVWEDYKRLFGKPPKNPDLLVILSDSNATESRVTADFDDFVISKE